MIKELHQPSDIKEKYTVVKDQYKIRKESKPLQLSRHNCIKLSNYSFVMNNDDSINIHDTQKSPSKMVARSSFCKMLRNSSHYNPTLNKFDHPEQKLNFSNNTDSALMVNNNNQSSYLIEKNPNKLTRSKSRNNSAKNFLHLSMNTKDNLTFKNGSKKPSFFYRMSYSRGNLKDQIKNGIHQQPDSNGRYDLDQYLTTNYKWPAIKRTSHVSIVQNDYQSMSNIRSPDNHRHASQQKLADRPIDRSSLDLSLHRITPSPSRISRHRKAKSGSMFQ